MANPAQMLPDDMLADVLGRLPPRSLALSRCVCREWRAVIDARHLLRPDLLPLSLAGVFVNDVPEVAWTFVELFSRRSPEKKLGSSFTYPPKTFVEDHCNGLLLLCNSTGVLNPATGWRMALPEYPLPAHAGMEYFSQDMYLVFDPTVSSSHFEVFLVPRVPFDSSMDKFDEDGECIFSIKGVQIDAALLESQWPLSPYILNVFSSATGRWEKRVFHRDGEGVFHRDGEGAGTVTDMRVAAGLLHLFMRRRNAVYLRGALYVHCECDFFMKISLSTNKYHMIKPPPTVICEFPELCLGKSQNGIYFALLGDEDQLWVWILAETNGQAEWILRHGTGAGLLLPSLDCITRFRAPWILHHVNGRKDDKNALAEHNEYEWDSDNDDEEEIFYDDKNAPAEHNEYEWDSDNDDEEDIFYHNEEDNGYLEILAFHPYKEILFFHRSRRRGLAYHLNSSKLARGLG